MLAKKIYFHEEQAICVFPDTITDLEQNISALELKAAYPVIVLIGGDILERQATTTSAAIQTLARVAEEMQALMICGGTDMGVMAEIGVVHKQKGYQFPLVGITPKELVTWPGGPHGKNFLGLGKKRWDLAEHYTHFILVPGSEFGNESIWIIEAARILSRNHRSVTILINGGDISRKDIELSVESGRPVIAMGGTGRLANDLTGEARQDLITVIPGNADERVSEAIRAAISGVEQSEPTSDLSPAV
jgi:molybdopterin biosynthesis enzyme MoaB